MKHLIKYRYHVVFYMYTKYGNGGKDGLGEMSVSTTHRISTPDDITALQKMIMNKHRADKVIVVNIIKLPPRLNISWKPLKPWNPWKEQRYRNQSRVWG